jgi:hypothetical protein
LLVSLWAPTDSSERGSPTSYRTVPEAASGDDVLETVFENGEVLRQTTFAEIKRRASVGL